MKQSSSKTEQGSVLLTAFLTITILTLICATSLYVTSQNQNSGMQTASWQQALAGAETGVDMAVRALNTGTWTNWKYSTYTGSLSTGAPSPSASPAASGTPAAGQYNYYYFGTKDTPAITLAGVSGSTSVPEGSTGIWGWVTVDTGGLAADTNGQWYRIRSTGITATGKLFRASNNRLDNDLRHTIGLRFDRKTGASLNNDAQATRSIEVIMQPLASGGWARAVTLKDKLDMSGGGSVDSFDSSNPFKSTNGQYDASKLHVAPNYYGANGDVGTKNSANSDLRNTYVWGDLAYSGTQAVKNTTNVKGNITTPFNPSIPTVSAPSGWTSGQYTGYSGGSPPFATTAGASKALIKVNGDLTVPGGQTLNLVPSNSGVGNGGITNYTIWVTGKLTTTGSGVISQDPSVKVTWYVGNDITISGDSYNNQSGLASSVTINAYGGNNKATISGSANFIATLNAPNYDVTVSGSGSFVGALIADTLTISGGAGFHFDEALTSGAASMTTGNYGFASWFEDNSDPSRKDVNLNTIIY